MLDAATGELLVRASATKRGRDFITLLSDLDRCYSPAAAEPAQVTKPVVLVPDYSLVHTSRASRAALNAGRPWLTIEWLPSYAPDLNAIKRCWRDFKRHYLANQIFADGRWCTNQGWWLR